MAVPHRDPFTSGQQAGGDGTAKQACAEKRDCHHVSMPELSG
jgi:hypothetical protein